MRWTAPTGQWSAEEGGCNTKGWTGTHRPVLQVDDDGVGGEVEALAGDVHLLTLLRLQGHPAVRVRHGALRPRPDPLA